MSTIQTIREFVTTTFARNAQQKLVTDESSLIEAGLIDSLGIVALLTFIEHNFKVKVPEQDVVPEHFDSINAIAAYIDQLKPTSRV